VLQGWWKVGSNEKMKKYIFALKVDDDWKNVPIANEFGLLTR